MSLEPNITKEVDGKLTLHWTSDPKALAYVIDTPTKSGVIAGKSKTSSNLGVHDEISVDIAPLYAQAKEVAVYPPLPVPPPSDWKTVANENQSFTLAEKAEVRYGKDAAWATKVLAAGPHRCDNATFGDPLVGIAKHCEARPTTLPVPPDPVPVPPTGLGLQHPAAGVRYGPIAEAMKTHDLVIAYQPDQGNPKQARAAGNPGLMAFTQGQIHPGTTHSISFTYGIDLVSWKGNAQVRAYTAADTGYHDNWSGGSGFKLDRPETAAFVRDAVIYALGLEDAAGRGYDGVFSDNLFWMPFGHQPYGASFPASDAAWNEGMKTIVKGIAAKYGMVGGNCGFECNTDELRALTQVSMWETLENDVGSADHFGNTLNRIQAWQKAHAGPTYLLVKHRGAPQANTALITWGQGLAALLGGAYNPIPAMEGDSSLYQSPAFTRNGQRHYMGHKTGWTARNGNIFTCQFEKGVLRADFATRSWTFG